MQDDQITTSPFVSIVICTYNRRNLLKDCLISIFNCNYSKSNYEVIVVDGGSSDGTEELCKKFSNITFVVERKFGLAYARNKGANLAHGSVIAYVDDDCIVDKEWLKNLVDGFRFGTSVMGVGGPVYPQQPEVIPKKIFVLAPLGFYDEGRKVKLVSGIVMPNSAFRRELFKTVQFDEDLGVTKRGKLILIGEDTDFCNRIMNAGYQLLYTPFSKVYHRVIRERLTVRYILKHAISGGIINVKMVLKRKNSRVWAVRAGITGLLRAMFKSLFDRSFTSCYAIVTYISTLVISITSLDKLLVPTSTRSKNPLQT